MARKLIVEIIGDATKLVRSFNQSTTAANKFGTEVSGSMSKAERSFTRMQRVAAGGFIGGAALTAGAVALRKVFEAAAEAEQVLGQTRVALESTGRSWEDFGGSIQEAVAAQAKFGFDDEALFRTFSLFVRNASSVDEALRRNSIAMDIARARFIDLEQAATLVNKAALGQAGALRRVGIDAENGASGVELLLQLEREFGGAAEEASDSATASMTRFSEAIENAQESIGKGLVPAIVSMTDSLADAVTMTVNLTAALGDLSVAGVSVKDVGRGFSDLSKPLRDLGSLLPFSGGGGAKPTFGAAPNAGPAGEAAIDAALTPFIEGLESGIKKGQRRLKDTADKAKVAFGQPGFKALAKSLSQLQSEQFEALTDALTLKFDRAVFAENTAGALALLNAIEKAIQERIKTEGRTTELLRKLFELDQDRAAVIAGAKAARKADADKIAQDRKDAAAAIIDALEFGLTAAQLTPFLKDDLAALQVLKAGLQKQIAAGTDVVANQRRLLVITDQIADTERERTANLKRIADEADQRRQFRAIGLTAAGGEPIPGLANLRKQFQQLSKSVVGEDVPRKLLDRLALVGKALSGGVKNMKEPTREAINDLFRTIRGTFDQQADKGFLTKTTSLSTNKLLAGLGLTPELERTLKGRLSGFNTAGQRIQGRPGTVGAFGSTFGPGGQPINITVISELDGEVVGRNVTRRQRGAKRSNPVQKRGHRSGI